MDALAAIYNDSDDSGDDDDDAPVVAAPAAALAPAPLRAAVPVAEALPSADDLLSDMPDDSYLTHRPAAAAAPSYDAAGTSYNAVALPTSLSSQASDSAALRAFAPKKAPAAMRGAAPPAAAPAPRRPGAGANLPRQSGGELLPPQLRKPNKVTEDVAGLRVAKRAREP